VIDPAEVIAAILSSLETEKWDDPQRAVEQVVDQIVIPAYDLQGRAALTKMIDEFRSSPYLAAAVVDLSSRRKIDLLSLVSSADLLNGAVAYLVKGTRFEESWAWQALWFGHLSDEDRWRLVMELVDQIPADEDMLWLVGDGPLSELQMQPGGQRRIEELAKTNSRLAHILQLVRDIP